ncbi:imidazolonepropionase [Thorsellia kenyensis]|uniref:Imidazolonepropionase n=1 Tax=Thorsellia kenyensis TaxID=1549888 RepID=A0ABV6C8Q9_9GAMM
MTQSKNLSIKRLINGRYWASHHPLADKTGILHAHDLLIQNEQIIGLIAKDEGHYAFNSNDIEYHDLKNMLVTPGLIDCHTHLVFAGNRAYEWEKRLNGATYESIVKEGGGILSTVRATRESSEAELYNLSLPRLDSLMNEGVTTIEIKTGYGLDYDSELKTLKVIKELQNKHSIDISPTFLGAHAVPNEFIHNKSAYLDLVIDKMLPDFFTARLFEAVDIFCEKIAFSLDDAKRLFEKAHSLGIPIKAHAEQLSHLGASGLVAKFKGLSVDHIEYLEESDILLMKNSGTVATLLPLAFYFLKETKLPPIDLLRRHKIPIAVSTDFNPGTAPMASIRLAMNMAAVQFNLTPKEILKGVTVNAAKALNRSTSIGVISPNYLANLAIWAVDQPVEIFYELGKNPLVQRIYKGEFRKH